MMAPLSGYDNRSTVFDAGGYVLRKINADYFEEITRVYDIYREQGLEQYGIVATRIDKASASLVHNKHTISYPYEWTPNMYKDAVLFHLGLFITLDKYGLTLKDALPGNIVFSFCDPIFVDFTSLVRTVMLGEETWLVSEASHRDVRFSVVDRMLVPYLLIPFAAMMRKDYHLARTMLSERACNCGSPSPAWRELGLGALSDYVARGMFSSFANLFSPFITETARRIVGIRIHAEKKRQPYVEYIQALSKMVADADVTPRASAYGSYYMNKEGSPDFATDSLWSSKQKSVFAIMQAGKPASVLDIGANTGWFSILAARLGAKVTATDIDESSIDSLYLYAKSHALPILPLALSFDNLDREIYGVEDQSPIYAGRNFRENPLYLAATSRLQADMVLCLGLVHHLVLGRGMSFDEVMKTLALHAKKCLVVEFIAIDDKLIQNEPTFFDKLSGYSTANYNIDKMIGAALKYFTSVEIYESDSPTRKILVFQSKGSATDKTGRAG